MMLLKMTDYDVIWPNQPAIMINKLYDSEFTSLHEVGDSCLYITFKGFFSKRECELLMDAVNGHFELDQTRRFIQVWDCKKMARFEITAKNAWQEMLSKRSDQMTEIYLISNKTMFKLAGKLMSVVVKTPMKVIEHPGELPESIKKELRKVVSKAMVKAD